MNEKRFEKIVKWKNKSGIIDILFGSFIFGVSAGMIYSRILVLNIFGILVFLFSYIYALKDDIKIPQRKVYWREVKK